LLLLSSAAAAVAAVPAVAAAEDVDGCATATGRYRVSAAAKRAADRSTPTKVRRDTTCIGPTAAAAIGPMFGPVAAAAAGWRPVPQSAHDDAHASPPCGPLAAS